ncbi:MAG: hypothetical protein OQL16_06360 [Gammaproteobacteria bacterium]|nr:hypothetical protein [Gammaproteobacteria bacterium]
MVTPLLAGEWSGNVAIEARFFQHDGLDRRQDNSNYSVSALPEYYHEWNEAADSFTFTPFIRIDSDDSERSHADIRELKWTHVSDSWELDLGISKVFWGVTESQHLVDIINQTDLVENLDGEDKLGQPMVKFSTVRDWGTVDLFLLPGFSERTFPGKNGRLRSIPYVDTDLESYEDSQEQDHIDWAARWSHSFDIWDIGVSHFSGTGRDPILSPTRDTNGNVVLAPFYEQIDQTGLDVQATIDEWLLKLELISRNGIGQRYTASTVGFEYTLVGLFETPHDLGLLAEYLYDERGRNAPGFFEDDLFLGARWVWNDAENTEFLAGVIQDSSSSERTFRLEGSRRVGQSTKLNIEAQFFSNIPDSSSRANFNQEDFVQVELAWYF